MKICDPSLSQPAARITAIAVLRLNRKRSRSSLAVLLALLLCGGRCLAGVDAGAEDRPLVGVNYFAGWWEQTPGKWQIPGTGQDWRPLYPGRVPLLGEYNTQATMDREIKAASRYGVDFFSLLWYYTPPGTNSEPNAPLLNRGLDHFIASRQARRLRFMVEFCNHPPFLVKTDEEWRQCVDVWLKAFRHPSYLRVDGKLVFKIHSGHHFLVEDNQGDLESCKRRLKLLREAARAAGHELLIGFGGGALGCVGPEHPLAKLCDFSNTYMDLPQSVYKTEDYPYAQLAEFIRQSRLKHVGDALPYVPFVAAGWNPRPWGSYGNSRPSFAFPTREEWLAELRKVKADLEAHPNLGLPLAGGRTRKVFTLYAWNEFGEGGMVAPTRGEKYRKLEGLKAVFGRRKTEIKPQNLGTHEARASRGGDGLVPAR